MVSKVSILFLIIITSPFIVMLVLSIKDGYMDPKDWLIRPPQQGIELTSQLLMALNLIVWNYSGSKTFFSFL